MVVWCEDALVGWLRRFRDEFVSPGAPPPLDFWADEPAHQAFVNATAACARALLLLLAARTPEERAAARLRAPSSRARARATAVLPPPLGSTTYCL